MIRIVFEGAEATGKTTLIKELRKALRKEGFDVITREFPNRKSQYGKIARKLLKSPELTQSVALQISLLNIMDQHVSNPDLLEYEKDTVILDSRGFMSTLVYSDLVSPVRENTIFYDISCLTKHIPMPDLMVYLDPPFEFIQENLQKRRDTDIYEEIDLVNKIKVKYKEVQSLFPNWPLVILDSTNLETKVNYLVDTVLKTYGPRKTSETNKRAKKRTS